MTGGLVALTGASRLGEEKNRAVRRALVQSDGRSQARVTRPWAPRSNANGGAAGPP